MSKFAILLDMLKIAFSEWCDENDYHIVVQCMREYDKNRDTLDNERAINKEKGYPEDYNPGEHMERIRFFMKFGSIPNSKIAHHLSEWNALHVKQSV